jgi:Uma2 family endonuclease
MVTTHLVTAAEFLARDDAGKRYELIAGEVVAMPMAGGLHGEIESNFMFCLKLYLRRHHLGNVYPGDTGFFFSHEPEIVRFPDIAFVRNERLPPPAERLGFLDVIPDLVVEIRSPSERPVDFEAKLRFYLERGVPLAWAVYPDTRTVDEWRPGREPRTVQADEVLVVEDILPGFRLPVADIFR